MSRLNILHLSDLHYNLSSHCNDIRIILDALWKDLSKLKQEGLAPHCVIFSGDLVFSGGKENFDAVQKEFIIPLLQCLELGREYFFIAPGNHDVQINKINRYLEEGLKRELTSVVETNLFIDTIDKNLVAFERLLAFNDFKQSLESKYLISTNILYSTYAFQIDNLKIGIACLNSAWRASGGSENADHGKLLIGERQIDNAALSIKDADFKVGVIHHPFEWLNPFEAKNVKRRAFTEFDLLLLGHNHDPDPELIDDSVNTVVISNGGCLYQTREFYNGYTLINYDTEIGQIVSYLREYWDIRREFDEATNYAQNGKKVFNFKAKKNNNDTSLVPVMIIDRFNSLIITQINQSLLSSNTDSNAPKDIREIFVEPIIDRNPQQKTEADSATNKKVSSKTYTLNDLLADNKNFLLMGKKESGKTTLLNYLCLKAIENDNIPSLRLPFYINCQDIPAGKTIDSIKKAMLIFAYDHELHKNINIDEYLKKGKCLVLFDDFDLKTEGNLNKKGNNLNKVIEFVSIYNNNKFIFAADQDFYSTLDVDGTLHTKVFPELGVEYEKVYIKPFTRHQTRQLVEKWFQHVAVDMEHIENILDKVMQNIQKMHIPRTPVIISLLLWIFEKQENYVPTNRAALLEKLIEIVMEKLNISESGYANIDYRDREHYLSYIAYRMVKSKKYYFENMRNLEDETSTYLKEIRGLSTRSKNFVEYFFQKGIFIELPSGYIIFKYRCFCEYFTAKRMIEDIDFYKEVMTDDNYLIFGNEIDYLTGLQRNNKELLLSLAERIDHLFSQMNIDIDLKSFEEINIQSLLDTEKSSQLLEKARSIDDVIRDNLLDQEFMPSVASKGLSDRIKVMDNEQIKNLIEEMFPGRFNDKETDRLVENLKKMDTDQFNDWLNAITSDSQNEIVASKEAYTKKLSSDPAILYMINLSLFSRVIRNCELIEDLNLRKDQLNKCMTYWAKFLLFTLKEIENNFIDGLKTGTIERSSISMTEKAEQINSFFRVVVPLVFQSILHEELGSEKLSELILDGVNNQDNQKLITILYAFLYSDLKLPDYLDLIKKLPKLVDYNPYALELISYKLHMYYFIRKLSSKERLQIENLIAEFNMSLGFKGKRHGRIDGSRVKNLMIHELKEKHKKLQAQKVVEQEE